MDDYYGVDDNGAQSSTVTTDTMVRIVARNHKWIELPRGASVSVVVQAQGHSEITIVIGPEIPATLDAPGLILERLDVRTLRDFGINDRIWVKSYEATSPVLIWR
jgi:hypothetical protein